MSNLDLHRPQRQAPLGVAIMFLQNIRRAVNFVVIVLFASLGRDFSILGWGYFEWGMVVAVFFLIFSFLQYRKFYFYVNHEHFIIEKGVFRQEKLNVPFARIQSVNAKQNIVQRVLGLVGLKIDTAGSIQQEIVIPALSKDYANVLRDYLMERRYEFEKESEEGDAVDKESESQDARPKRREPLLKLDIADLLKVGFTQNHLRSGLVLFAIVNGYIWQFEELLIKPFEPYLAETAESFIAKGLILLPIGFLAFIIISVLTSLISTVLLFFDFQFYLTDEGMDIESGLINRNSYNVPYEKIQYFQWESNPLRRIIGYRTLKVKQAGMQAVNERKLIGIPGLKARGLIKILKTQYPHRESGKYTIYKAHRLLFIQRFVWQGLMPALIFSLVLFLEDFGYLYFLPVLSYLLFVGFLSYRFWQSFKLRLSKDFLQVYRGYIFPKRILIPNFKLQNVTIRQSFLQKIRGIVSIQLHTAGGTIRLRHLPETDSRELYDYLLYCIESSSEKWM